MLFNIFDQKIILLDNHSVYYFLILLFSDLENMSNDMFQPWPFPDMKNPPLTFKIRSKIAVSLVGTWSKIILCKYLEY